MLASPPAPSFTDQAIAALRAGNKARGAELLSQAILADPNGEQAWLWLSAIVTSPAERRFCLERVQAINPQNAAAQQGLASLPAGTSPPSITPTNGQASTTCTFPGARWRTSESDNTLPYTHHQYAYALSNPVIYTDPSGKFRCAETAQNIHSSLAGGVGGSQDMVDYVRFCYDSYNAADSWVVSSAAQQDALGALIRLFTEEDLPGGPSPRASRLRRTDLAAAAERLEFVLDYTATGLRPTQFGKDFNDSGFNKLYKDPYPPPDNNQVGHFLTAVGLGYKPAAYVGTWQTQLGLIRTQIRSYSDDEVAIRLIVGHEKVADPKGSQYGRYKGTKAQFEAATASDIGLFLTAAAADAVGNTDLRECLIRDILPDLPENGDPKRPGNSLEDLRLSIKGWRFGQLIRNQKIISIHQAAMWLTDNLR